MNLITFVTLTTDLVMMMTLDQGRAVSVSTESSVSDTLNILEIVLIIETVK
jgi:hypothetical protein